MYHDQEYCSMKNLFFLLIGVVLLLTGCAARSPNLLISSDPGVFTITSLPATLKVKRVEKSTEAKLVSDLITFDTWGRPNANATKARPNQGFVYLIIEVNIRNTSQKDINLYGSRFNGRTSNEMDRNVKNLRMYNELIMEDGNTYYTRIDGLFTTYEANDSGIQVLLTTIEKDAASLTLLYGSQILGTIRFR